MEQIDTNAISSAQKGWDNMAAWYAEEAEWFTSQGIITCAAMAEVFNSKRTLEVACGSGRHSNLLATEFVQPGSVLVSCDFSQEMVKMMK